jgi:imidazolonepropionase-like amidohydrolase
MRTIIKTLAKTAALGALLAAVEPIITARRYRSEKRDPVAWSQGPGEAFLLTNAEIVDVLTGTVLHKRGILVKDGRIEDILTEKKSAALEGVATLDAAGCFVIPGLINTHCHMLLASNLNLNPATLASMGRQVERHFEECITHGVTTVRDAGAPPLLLRRYMDRIEGGELLGPRVLSAGSFINAPGGYPSDYLKLPPFLEAKWGPFVRQVKTPQEARDAVKSSVEWGSNFIKIALDDHTLFVGQKELPVLEDEVLRALVDEAHDQGLKVSAHHRFRRGFVRGTQFGLDGMEHLSGDEVLEDAEVEAFVSDGRYIIPTVQVGWALAGFSNGDPYLDYPQVQQALANRLEVVKTIYPSLCEPPVYRALLEYERCYRDPSYTERRHLMYTLDSKIFTKALVIGEENLNKLYHAGALIGCGNDGGVPQLFAGILGIEMVLLESSTDMEPLDVLQAATINNARIIGMEDELGTVSKGKLADLVLLPGNPLENMEHVLWPNAVFKEGRLLYTDYRREMMGA